MPMTVNFEWSEEIAYKLRELNYGCAAEPVLNRSADLVKHVRPACPDHMDEPLWAGIFEPNAAGWVTSPIEAWDGLTVTQVRDKITGYL